MAESMIGILLDVSGSMESAYALDRSHDASVERTHAILTTTINIVKREAVHHNRQESVFASVFGLCKATVTCDLLSLLDRFRRAEEDIPRDGHQALIVLAREHGARYAGKWIKDYLKPDEAVTLYRGLRFDPDLIPEMIRLIPSETTAQTVEVASTASTVVTVGALGLGVLTGGVGFLALGGILGGSKMVASKACEEAGYRSDAYKRAQEIIKDFDSDKIVERLLQRMEYPNPRPVQEVSTMLDDLLKSKLPSAPSSSLHDRIRELLKPIKPYILGGTPMYKALNDAENVFHTTDATRKVLFILSDGMSGDGDPQPIARELSRSDVIIVTCFLTSDHIHNPRRLLYEADPNWGFEDGRQVLFEMSSTWKNTHTPISYLPDAKWELPLAGQSRLFIQANSLDVVNEFCEIVVSQMALPCDALVHLLETIDLATYINLKNAEFEPKKQYKGSCFANAIAAVFHLAMSRIVGRKGGIPKFRDIRHGITREYGFKSANTKKILKNLCPEYRLRFRQVNETGARQAINKRQPVVATFFLYEEQWKKFCGFYERTPKGILEKGDVTGEL